MQNHDKEEMFVVKISLATKMVILVTLIISMTIALNTYLSVKSETDVLTNALIQKAQLQVRQIASGTKSAFWSLNWIFIENLLQETRKNSPLDVAFAKVIKPNGEVYLADDRTDYGEIVSPSLLFKEETMVNDFVLSKQNDNGILLVRPVLVGEETWYVFMGLSLQSVNTAVKVLIIKNTQLGFCILLMAILVSIFISRSISKPLINLAASANKISQGNHDHSVLIQSRDEVGLLSHAFNRMIKSLKSTNAELVASEKRSRALVDTATNAKVGIVVIQNNSGQQGLIKYVNEYVSNLTGYSSEDLIGMSIKDVIHPELLEKVMGWFTINFNKKTNYQLRIVNQRGTVIPIDMSVGKTDFDGRPALVCYLNDITEKLVAEEKLKEYSEKLEKMVEKRTEELQQAISNLKNTQSQLLQAEKLASIGQLAAGISHEINTPIQYVSNNLSFLKESFGDIEDVFTHFEHLINCARTGQIDQDLIDDTQTALDEADIDYLKEEIPTTLEQTLDGVEQVSRIVRSMKEFSHPGVKEKTAIDINHAIENTVMVSRNEWKYVAEMETDLDPSLPLVLCLPGELNQVFLNLIINAAQAISDKAGDTPEKKGVIRITTLRNSDKVQISISDSGNGIPKSIQSQIFDPFFTTKEVGKGTGQGLAISHSVIVDKHSGHLSFETKEMEGATFTITLPAETITTASQVSAHKPA